MPSGNVASNVLKLGGKHNPFLITRYPSLQQYVAVDDGNESLANRVIYRILTLIIKKKLSPGDRLTGTKLAEDLGISRTPVALALARLASDGILWQRNNYQSEVAEGAAAWLTHIQEMRDIVEPQAAAKAAGKLPPDIVDDLLTLGQDASPTTEYDWTKAATHLDFALHLTVAEFCGNLMMKATIRKCWTYMKLSYVFADGCRATLEPEYQQHMGILSALIAGDAEQAHRLMATHIKSLRVGEAQVTRSQT